MQAILTQNTNTLINIFKVIFLREYYGSKKIIDKKQEENWKISKVSRGIILGRNLFLYNEVSVLQTMMQWGEIYRRI